MADIEEKLRIERLVADTNLVMQMCSIHTPSAAHFADNSSRHHIGTFANGDFCEMRVSGGNAIGVTHLDHIAKGPLAAGEDDRAWCRRVHGFLPSAGKVDTMMEPSLLEHGVLAPAIVAGDVEALIASRTAMAASVSTAKSVSPKSPGSISDVEGVKYWTVVSNAFTISFAAVISFCNCLTALEDGDKVSRSSSVSFAFRPRL